MEVHEYYRHRTKEDGGTPPILQGIKAAMCIRLKEEMGVERILQREEEMLQRLFDRLEKITGLEILGATRKRLGIVSFTGKEHALRFDRKDPQLINSDSDKRSCNCAGTYGHVLLNIDKSRSYGILTALKAGEMSCKPAG